MMINFTLLVYSG